MSTVTPGFAPIVQALQETGPARTARLVDILTHEQGISADAARQRLSRAARPVTRYPLGLLPRREAFFCLMDQVGTERYWRNLIRDLRATGTVYACALDAMAARGGVVPIDEFPALSGAPFLLKKQVSCKRVEQRLLEYGFMSLQQLDGLGPCFVLNSDAVPSLLEPPEVKRRRFLDQIVLNGLAEWIRKNGVGSYHKVALRGYQRYRRVGAFEWDLTAPSYLRPVRRPKAKGGFVAADVFAGATLDVNHIQYCIRKVATYEKTSNSGALLPVLMADGFTASALRAGHAAGLMLTTPETLFGHSVARALQELSTTLQDLARHTMPDVDRLYALLGRLSEIEGRAGNIRGVLFEFIAAHLARQALGSYVDIGVTHVNRKTGRTTDLDVVCVAPSNRVYVIECKAKMKRSVVRQADVKEWLDRLPTMRDYVATRKDLRRHEEIYALWTTGLFDADALSALVSESRTRTSHRIEWKDGEDVRRLAIDLGLRSTREALDQHYLTHPLATA